ncbi:MULTISPECIES: nucleotidyltransferase domain-containing protein [Niastella]|uniref:Nucleotidyltransferase domain-containing protein n=1 Tax=Niastella soli TaxID=2821487 RepID=A0ABS3YNB5_9BACT|nr:nucleotidyltransferase domain-containing protein [Niastella soli]MBO9199371.1 nucleotidyltransferase domain-containing protein [Niastella soli]
MQQLILDKLATVEKENGIRILYACESGSRGWEFPSPDSDYDVRFIYVRPYKYYLSVMDRDYDLNFDITGDLDMYGWDVRKVLQLMRKSNTTPFEWLQSPIIYRQEPGFRTDLWTLSQAFFGQVSNIHHYLGIARGAMDTIDNGNEIKIKKLFYVLRPLLAAKWCLEKQTIAPMTIGPLMTLLPDAIKKQVSELISLKANAPEGFVIPISNELKSYIDTEYARISEASTHLKRNQFTADELDAFFVNTITRYDHQ